jgi:ornithine cyclodeaminase/alanine dehydrogenase-like protein (mu-crystallin family)
VLRDGLDPERDGRRTRLATGAGELLLMPSTNARYTGAKLVTVAPGNPAAGLPLISGVYVLFDGPTLRPVAVLDGSALTALRTPATSALAVRHLVAPGSARLALFGTGVQAEGHVRALAAVLDRQHVDVVGRTPEHVERLVARIRATGLSASAATPADAIPHADVVARTTSATEPLFDGARLADHALVVAIGNHSPTVREVDATTVLRSWVVVESVTSALREAGEVVLPVAEGALRAQDLTPLADAVRGTAAVPLDRPRLFTGTGMPWQDLATAGAVLDAARALSPAAGPGPGPRPPAAGPAAAAG